MQYLWIVPLVLAVVVLIGIFSKRSYDAYKRRKAEEAASSRYWAQKMAEGWKHRSLGLKVSTARRMKNAEGEREAVAEYLAFLRKENPNATEADVWENARTAEVATMMGR